VAPLREALAEAGAAGGGAEPLAKIEFDCSAAAGFSERLGAGIDMVILAGMEAHVCVLQTAAGLVRAGKRVWVAQDAIASRNDEHRHSAIRVLGELGALVLPVEGLLFALVAKAGTPQFKAVSKLVK